jgi:hypothetical protein
MELETGLGTALRRNGLVKEKRLSNKQANDGGLAGFDLTGVLTPLDEFQVWLELAMDERVEPETRAMAAKISKEFDPLRRGFSVSEADSYLVSAVCHRTSPKLVLKLLMVFFETGILRHDKSSTKH